jgi:hypothetical protein
MNYDKTTSNAMGSFDVAKDNVIQGRIVPNNGGGTAGMTPVAADAAKHPGVMPGNYGGGTAGRSPSATDAIKHSKVY